MREKLPNDFLNQIAAKLPNKKYRIGYPITQNSALKDFYKWVLDSGLCDGVLNNVGDPFAPHEYIINSLDVEREVMGFFAPLFGYERDEFWGMITTGGTDSNNHGIYFGHSILKKHGKPIMYVSREAHYSNYRLADLQGIELRFIDTDESGAMSVSDFSAKLDSSRPALIVFALGTTFKGAIDDQRAINEVIKSKNPPAVYRHVDAALLGGLLIFDKRAEHLINQKELGYDSIAVSGHKFFGIDEPCGIFLCQKSVYEAQKSFNISYLHANMPMIECSRSSFTPLKLYWILNHYGISGFKAEVEKIHENTLYLKSCLDEMSYPAWLNADSNIVYFARPQSALMHKYFFAPDHDSRLGGELAHIVVMGHVDRDIIDEFIADLKESLK